MLRFCRRVFWFYVCFCLFFVSLPPAIGHTQSKIAAEVLKETSYLEEMYLGNSEAPVTLTVYYSMTCYPCKQFHDGLFRHIKKTYVDTGKVKLVLREHPTGPVSLLTSILARCHGEKTGDPKEFFRAVDLFYDNYDTLAADNPVNTLIKLSGKLGFDDKFFSDCTTNYRLQGKIAKEHQRAAERLKVTGTPTFFVNGTKVSKFRTAEEVDSVLGFVLGKEAS